MVEYDYVKTKRADVQQFKENQLPAIKFVLERYFGLPDGITPTGELGRSRPSARRLTRGR